MNILLISIRMSISHRTKEQKHLGEMLQTPGDAQGSTSEDDETPIKLVSSA
jgi:hypothetical protein